MRAYAKSKARSSGQAELKSPGSSPSKKQATRPSPVTGNLLMSLPNAKAESNLYSGSVLCSLIVSDDSPMQILAVGSDGLYLKGIKVDKTKLVVRVLSTWKETTFQGSAVPDRYYAIVCDGLLCGRYICFPPKSHWEFGSLFRYCFVLCHGGYSKHL